MKGSVLDILIIIVIFLLFAVGAVFGLTFLTEVQTAVSGVFPAESQAVVDTGVGVFQGFDYFIVLLLFGSFISVLITAFIIDSHPIFFVISLLFMIFIIILSAQVSNIYIQFTETPSVAAAASNFQVTLFVFQNLPSIVLVFTIILAIVMYGKIRGGGNI